MKPASRYTLSEKFMSLVKVSEGFRSRPYLCPSGVPTIGYGSTRYPDGTAVQLSDPPVSEPQAVKLLMENVMRDYAPAVQRYVQVDITQYQFDALVDFAYNAGVQALRGSTLLKKLNTGDYAGAAEEFKKWVYGHDGKGRPVKLKGLEIRREEERKLFMEEPWA